MADDDAPSPKKAARKRAAKSAPAEGEAPSAPKPKKATKAASPKAEAPAPDAPARPRVEKTRVVFAKDYYEPHKDEIKAPFKAHGLKWSYLGEGKGLYKKEKDVHCFTQFLDDGTHYSIWGDDKAAVQAILDAWRTLAGEALFAKFTSAGESATLAESQQQESDAMRLWKLGEPQARPGEPEFFLKKRREEWLAKRPSS